MSRFFKSVAAAGRSVGRMTSAQPTTTISALLAAAADRAVPVVRGVRDDQLEAPTPCADYTVRDLLNHLFHIVIGFTVRAAKTLEATRAHGRAGVRLGTAAGVRVGRGHVRGALSVGGAGPSGDTGKEGILLKKGIPIKGVDDG